VERILDEATIIELLSEWQHRLLNIIPRLGSMISLACAAWLIWSIFLRRNPNRRGIFHRLMMGCGVNIMILQLNILWGQWAVPVEFQDEGFPMARGNTATCSAQGFLYIMGFVVPSYYVTLSVLCYLAIRHKFRLANYRWIEPYVHVGVYLFPLASASYLFSVQAYNPAVIDCYFVSLLVGCGDESSPEGIDCERGPSNNAQLARWLIGLPLGIILLFPTLIMAVLYVKM
jgi:hypothetical protein